MKIQVTTEDIETALKIKAADNDALNSSCCPVYQAIKRQNIFDQDFLVFRDTVVLASSEKAIAAIPLEARVLITSFDNVGRFGHTEKEVQPLEFELEIYEKPIQKTTTSEEGC